MGGLFYKQLMPQDTVHIRLKDVAIPIANALQYMHSNDVMYLNVKPANIGFDPSGTVKLFDFGLAIHNPTRELMEGMVGTLRYVTGCFLCVIMVLIQCFSFFVFSTSIFLSFFD